ncbi:glycerophosphodiester phosphodiesterase family protein [Proteiniphilum sp. UBA5463]|jgi:glycerophosphoryl diester phosphodiesterase|uniref:glycerophosphodiester phosphodiesterase family protein n=1 Tax=Proteiniphilum sp. UBA5463 TaxID=1947281 RepID=UPI00257F2B08|nr:glycerophosphodiester phosphodiesterase family protein [Proteiniphilum sp. UBA5463]
MKTKLFIILSLIIVQFSIVYCQSAKGLHTVKVSNLQELQGYFSYKPDADIIISAHRGGMLPGYPENCIESCEKTLSLIPSFFEIDPRFTKDGVMVLMHDADIKRTTNGEGLVSDYTYKELQQFNLKDRDGNVTPYKIPTIVEMFEWGKEKTVFNLDNKDNGPHTWDYYIKQLKEGGEWYPYKNIMLSVRSLKEAMYYWENGVNDRMFCVEISSKEHFDAYDSSPIPWNQIMAYIRLTVDPEQEELYGMLHERGVSIMTSIHPTADRVGKKKDRRIAYLRELVAMPDIIETDYPSEFTELPRTREELSSLREKAVKRIGN